MRLFLCLVIAGQSSPSEIQDWLERLGSPSIAIRDEAEQNLIEAGEAVREAVRSLLSNPDPEIVGRAESILASLDLKRKLRPVLSDPSRVTLYVSNGRAADVGRELAMQSGDWIDLAQCAEEGPKVALSWNAEGFWTALDSLCEAHGAIQWEIDSCIRLRRGKYVARPFATRGPLMTRIRGNEQGRPAVEVGWERGTRPAAVVLRLDKMIDGSGKSLLPLGNGEYRRHVVPQRGRPGVVFDLDDLAPAGDSTIREAQGEILVGFPITWEESWLSMSCAGSDYVTIGGNLLQLGKVEHAARELTGAVSASGMFCHRLEGCEIDAIDASGWFHPASLSLAGEGEGERVYEIVIPLESEIQIRSLRCRIPKETHWMHIPFCFRGVRLS